jgi:hypothetical protein
MKQTHKPLVTKRNNMNMFNNSRKLFELFNMPKELYRVPKIGGGEEISLEPAQKIK